MKTILLTILLFLSACASLGPKFDKLQTASKNKALVYVYRPAAFTGSARSPDIFFNGKKVGTSSNGSYFFFEADVGPSKVVQRNFAGEETGELEFKLKSDQVYFLRMDLGLPTLKRRFDSDGKESGQACPFQGLNFTFRESDLEILKAMDKRVQSNTCWPGFMFVSENLARRELLNTQLSK
jgi:hypothetical protein